MKRHDYFSKFFIRLLLLSCVIGIIPLALLGYLSYIRSASIIQEEVQDGNRIILQQLRSKIEYMLQTADTLSTQMANAAITESGVSMVSALRLPYTIEHRVMFEHVKRSLVRIQVFELGINDVNLISFDRNWLIDNGIVYKLEDLDPDRKQDSYLQALSERLAHYGSLGKTSFWTIEVSQDDAHAYVLKLVKQIPLNTIRPVGIVTVNIPLQEISKRMTRNERLGAVLIVDDEGTVISHPDESRIGSSVAGEPYFRTIANRLADQAPAYFTHHAEGNEIAVTYDRSGYNGWIYISLASIEEITAEAQAIQDYTLIVATLIVGLVLIASILVSKRMSVPVQRIVRFLASDPESGKAQGDELEFIGEQVEGMVRKQHRLVSQIQGLNRQAKEYFVMKLLRGELKSGELEEQLERYGLPTDWEAWCVFSIQIDTLEQTRYAEREKELLLFAIHNMVGEIVPEERRLDPIVLNHTVCTLIGKSHGNDKPFQLELYALAEDIQSKVMHFLGLKVSVGVSRIHERIERAPIAYRESLDALTYRIRLGYESILFMDDVQPLTGPGLKYPKELERGLVDAVKQLDVERAAEDLNALIRELLQHEVSHLDTQAFLTRLLNNFTGIVHEEGGSLQEAFPLGVNENELKKLNSTEEISTWFVSKVLTPTIAWLEERRKSREIDITEEVLKMIREQYDTDLTIELCAARLNFHPNYISRVFKKETGTTFSNVLSQYRVDVAKRWLTETDMRISEISERLRYSHTSNFIRSFKKSEGMTPNQYREQREKEPSSKGPAERKKETE